MKLSGLFGSLLLASAVLPLNAFATDSSFYFRCNSTDWEAVEDSRMKPIANGRVVSVAYTVSDAAVGAYGEDCALSETPAINAWGEWQKDYNLNFSALNLNAHTAIGEGSAYRPFNFKVNYSGTGTYRAFLNLDSKHIYITKDENSAGFGYGYGHNSHAPTGYHPSPVPVPATSESYYYLRCNATSWQVDDTSRFKPAYGDVLSLSINVNQDWFVSNGDECSLTQTPAFNAWGEWQNDYDLDGANLDTWNSAYTGKLATRPYKFKVSYSGTGAHTAYLNTKTYQVWIRKN